MTLLAMVLEDRASSHLFRSFPIAARFLSALSNVLVHALFLRANAF